jgi:SAM-dependent methyltransferase
MCGVHEFDEGGVVGRLRNVTETFPLGTVERGINRNWVHYLFLLRNLVPFWKLLPHSAQVCDIGSGAAVVPLVMAQLGFSVSVVDRWSEYAAECDNQMGTAEDLYARFCKFGVRYYSCDLLREAVPLPDASQDFVSAYAIIEHLTKPNTLLAEIKRLLKPGGFVVVSAPNCANLRNRLRLLIGRSPHPDSWVDFYSGRFFGHIRELTRRELRDIFEREGYEILSVKTSSSSQVNTRRPGGGWGKGWKLSSVSQLIRGVYLLVAALVPGFRYDMLLVARKPELR